MKLWLNIGHVCLHFNSADKIKKSCLFLRKKTQLCTDWIGTCGFFIDATCESIHKDSLDCLIAMKCSYMVPLVAMGMECMP